MSEENKQLAQRWFEEVWNKQDDKAIDEMFAHDGKCHGFPEPHSVLVGPNSFKEIHKSFIDAFPDIRIEVGHIICEGYLVAITWNATMTHLGDALGFPPTLEKTSLEGCSILIARNGQIQEGWNYMELQGLLQRLKASSTSAEEASAAIA